ncbi:MAG: GNAT family N-acetyltransferase [Marinibacterium sp.]
MTFACETPATGPGSVLAARIQSLIPRLETESLILRAPRVEDFPVYASIVLGPRGRHIPAETREDAWYGFTAMVANWIFRGHGVWAIDRRQDETLSGFVLLGFEPGDEVPELGFLMTKAAEGCGIAHEAAQAVLAHARETLHLPDLVSYVATGNTRSSRLAQRLGGRRDSEAEAVLPEDDLHVWRYSPEPIQ